MGVKGSSAQGKHSREKGCRFERQIAKQFTEWYRTGGYPDAEFRRTPMSGAYGPEWNLGGDLMVNLPFPFYVELKDRETWRLEQLLDGVGPVKGWVEHAQGEARLAGLVPMVIIARNHVSPLMLLPTHHPTATAARLDDAPYLRVCYGEERWYVQTVASFLATTPPRHVQDTAQDRAPRPEGRF